MGGLTSRPKAPRVQTPATPVVVSTPTPVPVNNTDKIGGDTAVDQGGSASDRRAAGLLNRGRGRLGTIATGFRGLLGLREQTSNQNRKTLLGE